ncbi:MAG: OmpA family protein [Bacteroidota bacterium]
MKKCIIIICTLFSLPLFAQRAATDYGDLYYEFFQFKEAARYYEEALSEKKVKDKQYLNEQLSQCYKYLFQYKKAEEYLAEVMKSEGKIEPEFYIDYGNILKLNGKYAEAKEQFKKYQEVTGSAMAESYLRSLNWAIRNADTVKNYGIFPTDLNISGQSLGYCFYDDGLIYAHARNKKPIGKDLSPLFDLDYARNTSETEFKADLEMLSLIQFDLNEGSPSISSDRSTLYFSANSTSLKRKKKKTIGEVEVSAEGVSNFKIYSAQTEGGYFQNPVALPFNNNEYNCIHPFIMDDGETLLFSSNMPGGFGGFDLYKSKLQGGVWSEPENLGKTVNTEENELFPWVNDGMLYFSSKGFNNYGGYDVYIAKMNKGGVPSGLKNLGQPVNSFRDDVAFITKDGGRTGYFSSNRGNDEGNDNVYFFRETVPVAKVAEVIAQMPTDSAQTLPVTSTPTASAPVIIPAPTVIPPPAKMKPTVAKRATAPKKSDAKKPVVAKEPTIAPERPVVTPEQPVVTTEPIAVSNDMDALVNTHFTPVLFRFNDAGISAPQMDAADSIAQILKDNRGLKVYISAHTDSRGSFSYNIALANKRGASLKRYLLDRGVPAGSIITKGLGESQLLNECTDNVSCTDEQHAINRRVEMRLVR